MRAGRSFNGRTTDSDSVNRGSNPFLPAMKNQGVRLQRLNPFSVINAFCPSLLEFSILKG